MEKLYLEIENQLALMEQYKITPEELMVIWLLFMASAEECRQEYLLRYLGLPILKTDFRQVLLNLQEKGIIVKSYKIPKEGQTFDPESVIFNENFVKNYKKYSGDLGGELWNCYPTIGIINGREYSMKNFAKKFNSQEDLFFRYGKNIGWKLDKHKEVISLITWAKQNKCNLLNVNIADFVISKTWEAIAQFKDNDYDDVTFDTITEL